MVVRGDDGVIGHPRGDLDCHYGLGGSGVTAPACVGLAMLVALAAATVSIATGHWSFVAAP